MGRHLALALAALAAAALALASLVVFAEADRADPAGRRPWIVVGIDGGEWRVVERLWEQGRLPEMRALSARGLAAPLLTDYGASPVIWTTIATGVGPDRHGIADFVVPTEQGDVPVSSSLRKVPAIWNMLTAARRRVAVLGWWASWPAEEVDGVVLTDRSVLDIPDRVHPPELLPRVEELLAAAPRRPWPELGNDVGELRDRIAADLAVELADDGYDLMLVYLRSPDLASHTYWRYWEPEKFPPLPAAELERHAAVIPRVYEAVDAAIGTILRAAPRDVNLLVVSDHGFRAAEAEQVKVRWDSDALLAHLGFLERTPAGGVAMERSRVYTYASPLNVARKRLRFARAGRDAGGTVTAAEEEAIRGDLAAALERVRFGNGEVAFTLDLPRRDEARESDLLLRIRRAAATPELTRDGEPLPGVLLEVHRVSGIHYRHTHGMLLAAGPDVLPGGQLDRCRVHDVTPTLLYALGLPIADDFEGRVCEELFTPGFRAAHPVRRIATWGVQRAREVTAAPGDEALLAELRALGYLD